MIKNIHINKIYSICFAPIVLVFGQSSDRNSGKVKPPIQRRTWKERLAASMGILLLVGGALVVNPFPGNSSPDNGDDGLSDWSSLNAGWNTLYPGGSTICANGDPYPFYVRPANTDSLLVYFEGGGACWNAVTCDTTSGIYDPRIDFNPARGGEVEVGVLDFDHPDNPLSGYSMVVIPYCTGDLHLGDRDMTYVDEAGEELTIPHRGQTNAWAVLNWMFDQVKTPKQVVIMGSSGTGACQRSFSAIRDGKNLTTPGSVLKSST